MLEAKDGLSLENSGWLLEVRDSTVAQSGHVSWRSQTKMRTTIAFGLRSVKELGW